MIDTLFFITVRGSISKVRRTRQFMVGDDGFVYALLYLAAKRIKFKGLPTKYSDKAERFLIKNLDNLHTILSDELIFSVDGYAAVTPRAIYVHFDNLLERAEVQNVAERGIVHYSFRHSFITHKVNSGLDLAMSRS